jgi:uncharacterized membrane protein
MSRRRFRDRLPFAPKHETDFRWRSRGSSRLEGLSDAVFGFALTLLVVSTEAPRDFAGLINVLREFPPFVACFALLMYFWNEHYRFFRRYGLEDLTTRMLNYVILLLVVFSIYPLKFLFTGWFAFMLGPDYGPTTVKSLPLNELYALYIVYGSGMAAIFATYTLLFRHAWSRRDELQLTAIERMQTRAAIAEFSIQLGVCVVSVTLATLRVHPVLPGFAYASLGVFLAFNGWWHGRAAERLRLTAA